MGWSIRRRRARLIAGAFLASVVSLASVASASAQALPSPTPGELALPTALVEMRDLTTVRGAPPTMGVTLDQSRQAFNALAAPDGGARLAASAAAEANPAPPPITAVFMAPVGVLSVLGSAQADVITVSRDAAGNLLIN